MNSRGETEEEGGGDNEASTQKSPFFDNMLQCELQITFYDTLSAIQII